jgi:hypothetical protein
MLLPNDLHRDASRDFGRLFLLATQVGRNFEDTATRKRARIVEEKEMKIIAILAFIAVLVGFAVSTSMAMKPLDDYQLDVVAAGTLGEDDTLLAIRVEGNKIKAGDVKMTDHSTIDNSTSVSTFQVTDANVKVNAVVSTIGNSNKVGTGANVMAAIDRGPGLSGSDQGRSLSLGSLGGMRSISQSNNIAIK